MNALETNHINNNTIEEEVEEGPAFISFSALPDEDVYEFVSSVDSLRKHFKWSNQVTFCYARTMLKGSARKLIQQNQGKAAKPLSDEATDPDSWINLRSSLVFEYSDTYKEDRQLVVLMSMRQQTGESNSEYSQRFVSTVSALVLGGRPLDSGLLAMLFANGLRSDKLRWEILLRKFNTFDKAVGYVAPEQLYKVSKINSQLVQMAHPSSIPEKSPKPTDDEVLSSTASESSAIQNGLLVSDYQLPKETGYVPSKVAVRSSTANGASFNLEDDGDEEDEDEENVGPAMPIPYDSSVASATANSPAYWTMPNNRNSKGMSRNLQRQSMFTLLEPPQEDINQSISPAVEQPWTNKYGTMPRQRPPTSIYDNTSEDCFTPLNDEPMRRYTATSSNNDTVSGGTADDNASPTNELSSLADQLENLSSMLRVESTNKKQQKRQRPRLCYRCRQKGHMASDCPLPADVAVPNQQMREQMTGGNHPVASVPQSSARNSRNDGLASLSLQLQTNGSSWRINSIPLQSNSTGDGEGGNRTMNPGRRRNTQSWNWSR